MAHLIDKSALVAELKRRMDENSRKQILPQYFGMIEEDLNILSFLDTLEVKEVDLDKEIDNFWDKNYRKVECGVKDIKLIGEHFFELGLKVAQKGEKV